MGRTSVLVLSRNWQDGGKADRSQSNGWTGTLKAILNQLKTLNPSEQMASSPAGLIFIALLVVYGCNRNTPTRLPRASRETERHSPDTIGPINESALRNAALKGQVETVRQALEQGVDVDATDAEGRTSIQLASQNGHHDVAQVLRQ